MKEQLLNDIAGLAGMPLIGIVFLLFLILGKYSSAKQLFVGIFIAVLLTVIIRTIYFKLRPNKQKAKNFLQRLDVSSFPSLHSMRAAVVAVIVGNIFQNNLVCVLLSLGVISVGTARVLLKKHHLSDVIAGIISGLIIGFAVITLLP